MGMKFISAPILARFGYKPVLVANTVMIGATICLYALVTAETPLAFVVATGWPWAFSTRCNSPA
jgi:hypothetical protein